MCACVYVCSIQPTVHDKETFLVVREAAAHTLGSGDRIVCVAVHPCVAYASCIRECYGGTLYFGLLVLKMAYVKNTRKKSKLISLKLTLAAF